LPVEHELVMAVRKELAIALRDLMQHGLMEVGSEMLFVKLTDNSDFKYLHTLICRSS